MGLEDYSPDQIAAYEHELLAKLRELRGRSGNVSLNRALGWDDDELYWGVRNRFVDAGLLRLGRGRGGSVGRQSQRFHRTTSSRKGPRSRLPRPICTLPWQVSSALIGSRTIGFRSSVVEVTAPQGRRATGVLGLDLTLPL